jgi:hypothetical protein
VLKFPGVAFAFLEYRVCLEQAGPRRSCRSLWNGSDGVAFNTLEHWAQDVSKDIALEIQARCDINGNDVPEALRDFVDSHGGPDRQLASRLV